MARGLQVGGHAVPARGGSRPQGLRPIEGGGSTASSPWGTVHSSCQTSSLFTPKRLYTQHIDHFVFTSNLGILAKSLPHLSEITRNGFSCGLGRGDLIKIGRKLFRTLIFVDSLPKQTHGSIWETLRWLPIPATNITSVTELFKQGRYITFSCFLLFSLW